VLVGVVAAGCGTATPPPASAGTGTRPPASTTTIAPPTTTTTTTTTPTAPTKWIALQGSVGLEGVACPLAGTCLGVGTVGSGSKAVGAVVPLRDGAAGSPLLVSGTAELYAVACWSAAACAAVGTTDDLSSSSTPVGEGVVVPIVGGVAGPPQLVGGTNDLFGIACESIDCEAVGQAGGNGVVVPIDQGSVGAPAEVPGQVLDAISCADATTCEAAGDPDVLVQVVDGTPGAPVKVNGATALRAISCSQSGACEAIGSAAGGSVVVTVEGGTVTATESFDHLAGEWESIACPTTDECLAVGIEPGIGNYRPLLVAVTGSQPGAPKLVNENLTGLQSVSCASATSCTAVGDNLVVSLAPPWLGGLPPA
jgi:hypothetical protein